MSGYDENSVVSAAVNGLHGDINGETENMALKAGVSSVLRHVRKSAVNFPVEFQMTYELFKMSGSLGTFLVRFLIVPRVAISVPSHYQQQQFV